jgi:pyruvate dehydrogenase E2 component (dihydrolipoamide acetyltransferase)
VFRVSLKAEAEKKGLRLTPIVFIMKAVVAALQQYPRFNASLDPSGENLIIKRYYNIGVAVDTPNGLMVPVIRDVDKKGLYELARELGEISVRAREGSLTRTDLEGGNFTISSLGGIGGTQFTPIVNSPEVAILGVSRSQTKPLWNGKEFEPRLMLPLALSYDHRVIDGAAGARFVTTLNQLLHDLRKAML